MNLTIHRVAQAGALREKLRRYWPTSVRRRQRQRPGRIMITYRRGRSSTYAGRLYDSLAAHFGSERLLMDITSIEPGADFVRMVDDAINSATVVLAVIDRDFVGPRLAHDDDWLRRELALTLKRSNTSVIPILVGGATMPTVDQLPRDLAPLVTSNAVTLSEESFTQDVARLIDTIESWLGGTEE